MTRATTSGNQLLYDPEIERSNRARAKALWDRRRSHHQTKPSQGLVDDINLEELSDEIIHLDPIQDEAIGTMADAEQTIRDMTYVPVNQQPCYITYPTDADDNMFEMRSRLLNSLPNFYLARP